MHWLQPFMSNKSDEKTHFGYETIPSNEKAHKVGEVFHSVAKKYDIMNDVMSLGMHRLWKRFTIQHSNVKPGDKVLDIAGGTGDIAKRFAKKVGNKGQVILSDINGSMLNEGKDRLTDLNIINNVSFVQADAQKLPFAPNSFNCLSIGFGLRNVTDKAMALRSMYDVLKPGGKVLILEFSKPNNPLLNKVYDKYSFGVIPKIGGLIANDKASYQYLVESIRMHPGQQEMLGLLKEAGFEDCGYHNLAGGIVALHYGYKI